MQPFLRLIGSCYPADPRKLLQLFLVLQFEWLRVLVEAPANAEEQAESFVPLARKIASLPGVTRPRYYNHKCHWSHVNAPDFGSELTGRDVREHTAMRWSILYVL